MTTYVQLTCPLPGCGHQLHLTWTNGRALYNDDLTDPPAATDLHTSTWQVQCEDGHVVLVPTAAICTRCGGDGCVDHCDTDCDDDYRTFRKVDADRLAVLCAVVAR